MYVVPLQATCIFVPRSAIKYRYDPRLRFLVEYKVYQFQDRSVHIVNVTPFIISQVLVFDCKVIPAIDPVISQKFSCPCFINTFNPVALPDIASASIHHPIFNAGIVDRLLHSISRLYATDESVNRNPVPFDWSRITFDSEYAKKFFPVISIRFPPAVPVIRDPRTVAFANSADPSLHIFHPVDPAT